MTQINDAVTHTMSLICEILGSSHIEFESVNYFHWYVESVARPRGATSEPLRSHLEVERRHGDIVAGLPQQVLVV